MLFFLCSLGWSDPFYPKTMQGEWNPEASSRSMLLPKGWSELDLNFSSKISNSFRDEQGLEQSISPSIWTYNKVNVSYRHGLSNHVSVFMDVPWVLPMLFIQDGEPIYTFALGDVSSGFQILHSKPTSPVEIASGLTLKSPSGVEWPASAKGSPNEIQGFLTGTGTTNLTASLAAKMNVSSFYAIRLNAAYTYKFRAVVGYLIEEDGFGHGKLKPGNAIDFQLTNYIQFHPSLSMRIAGIYSYRGIYYYGVSGAGIGWENPQELIPPGFFADGLVSLQWEPSPLWSWKTSAQYQILGSDTQTFATLGLDEFSPQPGWVYSLGGTRRW